MRLQFLSSPYRIVAKNPGEWLCENLFLISLCGVPRTCRLSLLQLKPSVFSRTYRNTQLCNGVASSVFCATTLCLCNVNGAQSRVLSHSHKHLALSSAEVKEERRFPVPPLRTVSVLWVTWSPEWRRHPTGPGPAGWLAGPSLSAMVRSAPAAVSAALLLLCLVMESAGGVPRALPDQSIRGYISQVRGRGAPRPTRPEHQRIHQSGEGEGCPAPCQTRTSEDTSVR